jgi:glycosyltransferase involved in cell wall biosynthesis
LPEDIEKRLPLVRIYISMAYDLLFEFKAMENNVKERLLKQVKKGTSFVCDSELIQKEIALLFNDPKAIFRIPYGIELETLPRLPLRPKTTKGNIEIAALRNWDLAHNQSVILDAFEKLVVTHSNIRLHIAGNGPEKIRESRRIKRLIDSEVLIDHGKVTNIELSKILEFSHIYVSNAVVDGTSVTLLEAMYLKCLCLVPDLPSNREWINNEVNGFVFESLEKTLECSINLFEENDFVTTITQNAHNLVVENANWIKNSRDLVNFITDQSRA